MATEIPTRTELYNTFKNEVQSLVPDLTDWNEGSINDILAGLISVACEQALYIMTQKFNKTYFATAHGPEVTGGPDDLEFLATDHFGDTFARPEATKAVGDVTFSRANTDAGNVVLPIGTIVKTDKDANGDEQRFTTTEAKTMTGLTIDVSAEAVLAGTAGNVGSGTITNIESSLTDPSVEITNALTFSGGEDEQNDSDYREFISNKIEQIRGASLAAILAAVYNVAGVDTATAIEELIPVKEWDIGGSTTVGDYFRIPYAKVYIADENGTASAALIENVEETIVEVRAAGVRVTVLSATPLLINWDAAITLNPGGPNYAELAADPQKIIDSMTQYIKDLDVGADFSRYLARQAILAIWGSGGTGDLNDFVTNNPSGDVTTAANEKLIPDDITIS